MIIIPTIFSLLRIILTPIFIMLFWQGGSSLALAIVIFTIAALTDTCDGYFARKYNVVSVGGIFLDPIADKILIGSTFICFVLKHIIPWWLVVVIMGRDIIVTMLRLYALFKGKILPTTLHAKVKTVIQFFAIYLTFFWLLEQDCSLLSLDYDETLVVVRLVMYAMTLVTVYTGIEYVVAYRKLMRQK